MVLYTKTKKMSYKHVSENTWFINYNRKISTKTDRIYNKCSKCLPLASMHA